ncbi:hypothetical protein [Dyadobacter sandarakinus]|uniref:Uncharacterized protein n=1 Tax=Dyadobacter sandarakinus TaxID=2747268 RepID=A0ABX7I6R6_9BACT|nr:hypothetical protein [Dyadobacter sandarakinus]QRR01590.1 hypothetical protein HWI92_12075 [Dyadobacter sandarakinus]
MPTTTNYQPTLSKAPVREYDVIRLKAPMQVFTILPEKFLDPERPYSLRRVVRLVAVGDPIQNPAEIARLRGKVQGEIEKILEMPGLSYSADLVSSFVNYVLPEVSADTFTVPEGEYLVMRASEDALGATEIIARKFDKDHFQEKLVVSFLLGSGRPGSIAGVEVVKNLFE